MRWPDDPVIAKGVRESEDSREITRLSKSLALALRRIGELSDKVQALGQAVDSSNRRLTQVQNALEKRLRKLESE